MAMSNFPRLFSGIARQDATWMCNSCARGARQKAVTPFFKSSMGRSIHNTPKPRQNVAPTFEQLRAPFAKRNNTILLYTLSVILGTVALSYGSVPLYKMVRFLNIPHHHFHHEYHSAYVLRILTTFPFRSAKQQAGVVNPSRPQGMAVQQESIPPPVSSR